MPGTRTNERPGTRAQARYVRMSAFKVRPVLDLIRGLPAGAAEDVLVGTDREAAREVRKTLASAIANAANNDQADPETLQVVACYADEGPTIKRFRPRARGRATRINKRTSHITVIVARMSDEDLTRRAEAAEAAGAAGRTSRADRRARVAKSRQADRAGDAETDAPADETDAPAGETEAAMEEIDEAEAPAEDPSAEGDAAESPDGAAHGGEPDGEAQPEERSDDAANETEKGS